MQTEREAEALLRAVGERYAGLPSYRDHGCVRWQNEGLMDALAGPTGVSLGAAHTIPALLLPEASKGSWSLLQLNGVRLIARPANLEVARDLIWVGGTGWAGQYCGSPSIPRLC